MVCILIVIEFEGIIYLMLNCFCFVKGCDNFVVEVLDEFFF